MNTLSRILKFMVPPSDAKDVTPWRWGVFICVILLLVNAASGRGFVIGYGAYAAQADVQIILELQYAETIRNLQMHICSILPNRNPTLENTLEDYQHRYADLTGQRYPLLHC